MGTFSFSWGFVAIGVLFLVLGVISSAHGETMLYVSPQGNDAWSGSFDAPLENGSDGPLASLEGARDRIRALRAGGKEFSGPVRVFVRQGVYHLSQPFVLTPGDSGSWKSPISYEAYPGERPVFTGGKRITKWRMEGDRWVAEIPEVVDQGWNFYTLWVNGEHRRPARTPNEGFLRTAGKAPKLVDAATGTEVDRGNIAFMYAPGEIQRWANLDDVIVHVYQSWDVFYGRIADIDGNSHVVTFKMKASWPFEHWGSKQRYFLENYLEALDAPGEWYLDRQKGLLYYLPREGETIENTEVIAPVVQHLVRLEGKPEEAHYIEFVRFAGLSFQHTNFVIPSEGMKDHQAAYEVDAAFQARGARNCTLERCELTRLSNYGIWFADGCQNNRVLQCHVHDLGAGGIRIGMGGSPENDNLVTGWNVVDNCWIHDGGKIFPAAVGVWIGRSSYNTISHNDISDFYYTGVSVGWSWGYAASSANHNIIEYNHIHHLGKGILSDMGGIYLLGIAPGTILRNNLIHDVYSYSYGGWGIYPDEGSSDLLIENNVVYRTKTGGFHQHYGKENRVRNNIFAYAIEGQLQRSREEEHISFFFERNIAYFDRGALLSSTWQNGNFVMDYNCYWNPDDPEIDFAGRSFDEWRELGKDRNSIIADPLFRDPAAFDFRLNPLSPVFALGFRPIDVSNVGLYGDDLWRKGPGTLYREEDTFFVDQSPEPIVEDFEGYEVGAVPEGCLVLGETEKAQVRVTDEQAFSGKQSLRYQDAAGLAERYNPHVIYSPNWSKGTVHARFALYLEPGAVLYHEWRTNGHPYHAGPSVRVREDGMVRVGDRDVVRLEPGAWYVFELACTLGRRFEETFRLEIRDNNSRVLVSDAFPLTDLRFRRLNWFGFVSDADADVRFYLDALDVHCE